MSRIDSQEVKNISLVANSENVFQFGLVTEVYQYPDSPSKTYKAYMYSLGELGGETNLKIEKTESGQTKVSRIRNGESSPEIIGPQWKPKFYSESEKNTDNNWESFMERRGTYRKEGPIFLSYTSVRGSKTFSELREELKSMVEKGFIR